MATTAPIQARHGFQTDDTTLQPIAARVFARERLTFDDAVTLYSSPDILAIGWLANHVRERLHVHVAYFNVYWHINPTKFSVAACLLSAFGLTKDATGAYTKALAEAFPTAASGHP